MPIERASVRDVDQLTAAHVEGGRVAYRGIYPDELLDTPDRHTVRHATWTETLRRLDAGSADPLEVLLVSRDHEGVAGMVHARTSPDDDTPPASAEITALYVHPRAWRHRHGTRLVVAVTDHLRSSGAEGVHLWAVEGNVAAHRFYRTLGWRREVDRRRPLADVPDVHEVRFRLDR